MAILTWFGVIAMCIAPAIIMFVAAGVISIYKHATAWFTNRNEEVDHEL
ncbi:hypothetical protein Q4493_05270 [Colwellia sp. 1_MG-2023]|nr:hypothetical protein [Colwellia sp. 1_MG-2023]MDO6445181.1 hypothetical protein [Colwellia sp. 1_MG-2023]